MLSPEARHAIAAFTGQDEYPAVHRPFDNHKTEDLRTQGPGKMARGRNHGFRRRGIGC
jgi:hypothetical protein